MNPRRTRTLTIPISVVALGIYLTGCNPTGDPNDTTPPEFLQITVTVQRVTDGFNEPPTDATSGLTLDNVQRDRLVIIEATAADDQSGIKRVAITGETEWDCVTPGDDLAQHHQGDIAAAPDQDPSTTTASGLPALRNATFTIDPFSGNALRLVCPATDEASEMMVNINLVSTNGNDVEGRSPPISIEYQARPPS